MTFIVCVGSDSEEKGEGTLCDAYLILQASKCNPRVLKELEVVLQDE